jgi:hypothetical protein
MRTINILRSSASFTALTLRTAVITPPSSALIKYWKTEDKINFIQIVDLNAFCIEDGIFYGY